MLCTAAAAVAQDINTSIEVDRTIEPEVREAVRPLTFMPGIELPATQLQPLSLHEYMRASELTTITPLLAPVAYGDTIATSPYRGYGAIGYFPAYNLGASAGYRFINTGTTRLGANLQFDGCSYKGFGSTKDQTFSSNTLSVGADFNHLFSRAGMVAVKLAYKYGRQGIPTAGEGYHQNVNDLEAKALWHGFFKNCNYHVGIDFDHFAYGEGTPQISTPGLRMLDGNYSGAAQNHISAHTGINFAKNGSASYYGLEVRADYLHNTSGAGCPISFYETPDYILIPCPWSTQGYIRITPFYNFSYKQWHGSIGLNADISTGTVGKHFHVAPEVKLAWTPAAVFALEARFTGGERLNPLSELYDINQWTDPLQVHHLSHVPFDGRMTLAIGPFEGTSLKLFGGYSVANEWLINGFWDVYPTPGEKYTAWRNMLRPVDMKGWLAGATVGYSWRNYLELEATASMAPQSWNRGYYLWRDHARYVVRAHATGRPTDRLELTLGYEFRGRRMAYSYDSSANPVNLGNVNTLNIGALYRISDPLSVWVKAENLLNHRYNHLLGIAAQGIKGLVGVSYKF